VNGEGKEEDAKRNRECQGREGKERKGNATLVFLDDLLGFGVDFFLLSIIEEESCLGLSSAEACLGHLLHHLSFSTSHSLTKSRDQGGLDVVSNINSNLMILKKGLESKTDLAWNVMEKEARQQNLIKQGHRPHRESKVLQVLVKFLDAKTLLKETSGLNHEGRKNAGGIESRTVFHNNHRFSLADSNINGRCLGFLAGLFGGDDLINYCWGV